MSIKHFFLLSLCCAGLPGCATRETAAERLGGTFPNSPRLTPAR